MEQTMSSLRSLLCCGFLLLATTTSAAAQDSQQHELQELRQLVSTLVGAETIDHDRLGGFLPGTHNTQRLIARKPQLWPQHFTFLSAVAADSSVRCSHVMTDRGKLAGGPLYVVLGDQAGRLYFFTAEGHLLHEHDTGVSSSITAISSDLIRHNETHLLVGQLDGTLSVLSVAHEHPRLPDGSGIRSVHALMVSTASDRAQQRNDTDVSNHQQPIRHLMYGRSNPRRTLLAVDAAGRVLLMLPNSGHILMTQHVTAGPPLAVNMNSNFQIIVQTDTATAILLMKRGRSLATKHCAGLSTGPAPHPWSSKRRQRAAHGVDSSNSNSSSHDVTERLVAAVFDLQRAFRVFGVTAGGDLVLLMVPNGAAAHACRVVQRVPLGLPPGHVHLAMAHGRLVLLHSEGIAAFNLSAHKVQLPGSYLVSHTWQQLWRLYGLSQQHQQLLSDFDSSDADQVKPDSMEAVSSSSSSSSGSGVAIKQDASSSSGSGSGSDVATQQDASSSAGSSSSSTAAGVLHTPAWDTPLVAAGAAHGLLMLPFGSRGMATFSIGQGAGGAAGSWAAAAGAAGGQGAAGSSGSSGGGADINWVKVLQPFVVIMMIMVGVWQFVRASNKSSRLASSTRRAGRYAAGLGGVPDMGGLLSRSQGLAGAYMMQNELGGGQRRPGFGLDDDEGLGSFSSLDRDFGPYAGPRGRRGEGGDPMGGGPLGALTARRRARAAMLGSRQADREQQGLRHRGPPGGQAGRRQGEVRRGVGGLQGDVRGRVHGSIAEEEEAYSEEDVVLLQQQQQQQDVDVAAAVPDELLEELLQQASQQQQQQQQHADVGAAVLEGEGESSGVLQQVAQQPAQQQQQQQVDVAAAVSDGDAAAEIMLPATQQQQQPPAADFIAGGSIGVEVAPADVKQATQQETQMEAESSAASS